MQYRKNTTLLFLLKPIDERELQHEVAELRKNQKTSDDITFHICANFARPEEGNAVVQTIRLIRKFFPSGVEFHYPIFVYGQMPRHDETNDELTKCVWKNLVVINNAVSDFIECRLLSTVYLYNDASQKTLAEFIFNICHSNISYDRLSAKLPVKQAELFGDYENDNEGNSENVDFPPIFGSFNTFGIRYPEAETLAHIHYYYILSALRFALPEKNETSIEICNEEARQILTSVPIATSRICLQEESFLNLNSNGGTDWATSEKFWEKNVEEQMLKLSDTPRSEWLTKIRQRVDQIYLSRFRGIGTEYFFKIESEKTSEYSNVLYEIISQEFSRTIQSKPYTPDAQKTIVRGIINILQQKVMEIKQLRSDSLDKADKTEHEIVEIKEKWRGLGLFSRLRGKDGQILGLYRESLTRLMVTKTIIPGCDFAIKLLNELIPAVSSIIEQCENRHRLFAEAMRSAETMVKETDPSELYGIFGNKDLQQTRLAIEADTENLLKEFLGIMQAMVKSDNVSDGEDLIRQIRETINEKADAYLNNKMESSSLPQLLGVSIVERIAKVTSAIGGFPGFVENMKRNAHISVRIKKTCQTGSKYLLTAPELTDQLEGVEHLKADDLAKLQLINIHYGLTLQDLDGFSGQRMFVEPSIF